MQDRALIAQAEALPTAVAQAYDQLDFSGGLRHVESLLAALNQYFHDQEPWVQAKTDSARHQTIMRVSLECLRVSAILLQPGVLEVSLLYCNAVVFQTVNLRSPPLKFE